MKISLDEKNLKRVILAIQEQEILLIADGIENIIKQNRDDFVFVLRQLFENCKNMRVLTTSIQRINFES